LAITRKPTRAIYFDTTRPKTGADPGERGLPKIDKKLLKFLQVE